VNAYQSCDCPQIQEWAWSATLASIKRRFCKKYFFKNKDGKLAIVITRESIDKASRGLAVEITGTATENGKGGKTRRIDARATPLDGRQGTLRLRFVADGREMVFDTRYKFVAPE
jgi:hypothetical protein